MRSWALLLLVACPGKPGVSTGLPTTVGASTGSLTGPTTSGTSGATTDGPCWGIITLWTDGAGCDGDTLDLCIVDPLGVTDWDFGMVTDDWTGEDCLNGAGAIAVCHPIHAPEHTLTQACAPEDVVPGVTTRFDRSDDPFLTYYMAEPNACFVWGDDPAYYAALGCDELM